MASALTRRRRSPTGGGGSFDPPGTPDPAVTGQYYRAGAFEQFMAPGSFYRVTAQTSGGGGGGSAGEAIGLLLALTKAS